MIIRRAEFITSMKDYGAYATKGCPEVAFAGKSNVGKSSMINRLTNRSKLLLLEHFPSPATRDTRATAVLRRPVAAAMISCISVFL